MNKTQYIMIYLLSCGVNCVTPDIKRLEDIDMEELFHFSKAHFLEVLVGTELKQSGVKISDEWIQQLSKSVRKNILFDSERKKLLAFMEQEGIWYLSLKGAVLKDFYPAVGMRQMSDNDILFDEKCSKKLQRYMESNGYIGENIGAGAHDVYKKEPVYNFEMHRKLFDSAAQSVMNSYYANVKEHLILNNDSEYGYHFSDEDFYIYITAHSFKHYQSSGTGIRSLLDVYVYLSAKEQDMDFEYIQRECEKLGMADFEASGRVLSKKVFGKVFCSDFEDFVESLSESELEMLEYYLTSGVYGTMERGIKNRVAKFHKENGQKSKFSYIFTRIFPGMDTYKSAYPFFYKHKWLLPIGWFYRLIRMVFSRKRRSLAKKEMDIVKKM